MTRVAIYARYSSELQQDRSIDDQFALCRDFAARRNWTVTITYADRAISGASIHGRHDFQQMLEDARDRRFDILLAEDIDRLARNQADGARLFERLTFLGIPIWTIADGETNEMLWGLKGTMSALFLKTHAAVAKPGGYERARFQEGCATDIESCARPMLANSFAASARSLRPRLRSCAEFFATQLLGSRHAR